MLRLFQQRTPPAGTVPAAPPAAATTTAQPVPNLATAIGHMSSPATADTTAYLKAWYVMLQENNPTETAKFLGRLNTELRAKGNADGEGPPFLLVNTTKEVDILTCLMEPPVTPVPNLPAGSPFGQHKYVSAIGNRLDSTEQWLLVPTNADQLFAPKRGKLAKWTQIKAPGPKTRTTALTASGRAQEFYPVLPLYGKDLCQKILDGLYPQDPDNAWSFPKLANELKPYVEGITHGPTKEQAKNSLLGLVSHRNQQEQAASIAFDENAIEDPPTAAAINAWATAAIEATLDPKVPAPAGVRFQLHPNGNSGGSQQALQQFGPNNNPAGGQQAQQQLDPNNNSGGSQQAHQQAGSNSNTGGSQQAHQWGPNSNSGGSQQAHQWGPNSNTGGSQQAHQWGPNSNTGGSQQAHHLLGPPHNLGGGQQTHQLGHSYGAPHWAQPPPHKQPRLEPNLGVYGLSSAKIYALMGHARVTAPDQLPGVWHQLFEQATKSDRMLWFKGTCVNHLKQQVPMGFNNFSYPPQFVEALHDLTLSDDQLWHKGLVGFHLRRSRDDIHHLNRLEEANQNQNVTLSVGPNDLHRLQVQTPVPIQDMSELIAFLQRLDIGCSMWFPGCDVAIAARLALALLLDGPHSRLATDPDWMRIKPNELIWILRTIEVAQFGTVLSEADFHNDGPQFYSDPNIAARLHQWLAPAPTVSNSVLPKELRPRPAPHRPGGNPGGGRGGGTPRGTPPGPPNNGRPPNNRRPHDSPGNAALQNQQFPPALRAFWDSVPANKQHIYMSAFFQAATTSTRGCLQILGLPSNACGLYHMRGACPRRNCSLSHDQFNYPQPAVDTVVGHLRQGLANSN